jgi:hypothetical protein
VSMRLRPAKPSEELKHPRKEKSPVSAGSTDAEDEAEAEVDEAEVALVAVVVELEKGVATWAATTWPRPRATAVFICIVATRKKPGGYLKNYKAWGRKENVKANEALLATPFYS